METKDANSPPDSANNMASGYEPDIVVVPQTKDGNDKGYAEVSNEEGAGKKELTDETVSSSRSLPVRAADIANFFGAFRKSPIPTSIEDVPASSMDTSLAVLLYGRPSATPVQEVVRTETENLLVGNFDGSPPSDRTILPSPDNCSLSNSVLSLKVSDAGSVMSEDIFAALEEPLLRADPNEGPMLQPPPDVSLNDLCGSSSNKEENARPSILESPGKEEATSGELGLDAFMMVGESLLHSTDEHPSTPTDHNGLIPKGFKNCALAGLAILALLGPAFLWMAFPHLNATVTSPESGQNETLIFYQGKVSSISHGADGNATGFEDAMELEDSPSLDVAENKTTCDFKVTSCANGSCKYDPGQGSWFKSVYKFLESLPAFCKFLFMMVVSLSAGMAVFLCLFLPHFFTKWHAPKPDARAPKREYFSPKIKVKKEVKGADEEPLLIDMNFYEVLCKNELKAILRHCQLPVYGHKNELILRLVEHYRQKLDSLSYKQLQSRLKHQGLLQTGKREELIARLIEAGL